LTVGPFLPKTKIQIIKYVIGMMWLPLVEEGGVNAIKFVAKAYGEEQPFCTPTYRRTDTCSQREFLDQCAREGPRFASKEEKDGIEEAMRFHLSSYSRYCVDRCSESFDIKSLNEWIQLTAKARWMPTELKMVLILARAKKGGVELALKDSAPSQSVSV
jgi:hypothetical protein